MPHQCLKCGRVFEEGSAQLLKGCPDCGGNRFFFTKTPLNEKGREEMTQKVGKDINFALMELIEKEKPELLDKTGNWVNIKPNDLRKAMQKHISEGQIKPESKEEIEIITDDEYRKQAIEKAELKVKKTDTPETIDIEKPGQYKIDVKGLLEEEPIIIQKDGSYTIHLPSIFKMIDKEK